MKLTGSAVAVAAGIAASLSFGSVAHAAAGRTFVSSTGNDSNTTSNCGLTAPCRSFASAYSVTTSGGEIVALDSAGYGTLTINSPISIIGALNASITVPGNSTGITITAGASDLVILRNIEINGGNSPSTTGIKLNSGRLVLQNSGLKLLTTGLSVSSSKADVTNSDIIGNVTGISTTGTGVDTQAYPLTGPTQVRISGGNVLDNTTAFLMNDPGSGNGGAYNKITIFAQYIGSSIVSNFAGNTTVTAGSGTSCQPYNGNQNCTAIYTYSSSVNGNLN